ncbi:MAG TPA: peptide deformylase [Flavobacterium sp.]|nr:peptide deformylase [Flavobacterium sp.]
MKKIIFLSVLFVQYFVFAQNFTKSEKELIYSGDIKTKMRVIQSTDVQELDILLNISQDISPKNKCLEVLINRMFLAVTDPVEGGVGIAAPQVGINRNVIWVQRFDKENNPFEVYINPKILWKSQLLRKGPEGCLSIPDIRGDVYRHYALEIEYFDQKGKKHIEKIEGFTAVIFQHEIDHLNGVLFTQRLEEQKEEQYHSINSQVNLFLKKK